MSGFHLWVASAVLCRLLLSLGILGFMFLFPHIYQLWQYPRCCSLEVLNMLSNGFLNICVSCSANLMSMLLQSSCYFTSVLMIDIPGSLSLLLAESAGNTRKRVESEEVKIFSYALIYCVEISSLNSSL